MCRESRPHPDGEIIVSLQRKGANGIIEEITLPGKITGKFIWKGKEVKLKSGKQRVILLGRKKYKYVMILHDYKTGYCF